MTKSKKDLLENEESFYEEERKRKQASELVFKVDKEAIPNKKQIETVSSIVNDIENIYKQFNNEKGQINMVNDSLKECCSTTIDSIKKSLDNNNSTFSSQKYQLFNENNKPINYGSCYVDEQHFKDNYLSPSADANYDHNNYNNYNYDDNCNYNNIDQKNNPSGNTNGPEEIISVSDIVGSFGWFQFLILLFSGLREGSVGYDAVVMSVILKPINNFHCADPLEAGFHLSAYSRNSNEFNETSQCFKSLDGHMLLNSVGKPVECHSWSFAEPNSLMAEWLLVCDRHWLIAFIESAYFLGLVSGNLVWGYYADKVGRRKAYLIAHSLALLFGWTSVFAPNIWLFAICRYATAFGSISYNIIYSIQVELIGTKHRSFSTLLNHLGWGLGVIAVPLVDRLFSDYRFMISLAPLLTLIMFPWAFWLPESSRWLMAKDNFAQARHELIRAAKFNGRKINPLLERKICLLRQKVRNDQIKQNNDNNNDKQHLYKMLFKNPTYFRDTLILSYVSFIGHLFYYMLTINFGYIKNLSVEANFISSGAGEWVSVLIGAILLKLTTRKFCLSLFLLLMSLSFMLQFLIDLEISSIFESEFIVSLNNGIGTLSALLVIFVSLIVNQEVYPTIIRQTGSSVVNTIAESGSTLAPMLIQISRIIGPTNADIIFSIVCLFGILIVQFLTKTDDIELPDT